MVNQSLLPTFSVSDAEVTLSKWRSSAVMQVSFLCDSTWLHVAFQCCELQHRLGFVKLRQSRRNWFCCRWLSSFHLLSVKPNDLFYYFVLVWHCPCQLTQCVSNAMEPMLRSMSWRRLAFGHCCIIQCGNWSAYFLIVMHIIKAMYLIWCDMNWSWCYCFPANLSLTSGRVLLKRWRHGFPLSSTGAHVNMCTRVRHSINAPTGDIGGRGPKMAASVVCTVKF